MPIVVVQVGSTGNFGRTSLTATSAFGFASSPGNRIIQCGFAQDYGQANGTYSTTDGTVYNNDLVNSHQSNLVTAFCVSRVNASGGTTAVSTTNSAGTSANSGGSVVALEVSGLAGFDATNSAENNSASSSTPGVGPSGSPLTTPSLVIAIFSGISSMAGATLPIPGFTTLTSDLTGVSGGVGVIAYQIVTSTAALSALLGTLSSAVDYAAVLGIYAGSTGAIPLASTGQASASGSAALVPIKSVTLTAPLYLGNGGVLDANAWPGDRPRVGSIIYYDSTYLTILPDGETVWSVPNATAEAQFKDQSGNWNYTTLELYSGFVSIGNAGASGLAHLGTNPFFASFGLAVAGGSASLTLIPPNPPIVPVITLGPNSVRVVYPTVDVTITLISQYGNL